LSHNNIAVNILRSDMYVVFYFVLNRYTCITVQTRFLYLTNLVIQFIIHHILLRGVVLFITNKYTGRHFIPYILPYIVIHNGLQYNAHNSGCSRI